MYYHFPEILKGIATFKKYESLFIWLAQLVKELNRLMFKGIHGNDNLLYCIKND